MPARGRALELRPRRNESVLANIFEHRQAGKYVRPDRFPVDNNDGADGFFRAELPDHLLVGLSGRNGNRVDLPLDGSVFDGSRVCDVASKARASGARRFAANAARDLANSFQTSC